MSVQESACARLTMLGRHVGSGLMAADMAVMLAQKRQESLARAEALAPRLSLPVKTLTAHRCGQSPQHHALLSAELGCMTLSAAPVRVRRAYATHKLTDGTCWPVCSGAMAARACQVKQY